MDIKTEASSSFIEELNATDVEVQLLDKSIQGYPSYDPFEGKVHYIKTEEVKTELGVHADQFILFTVLVNGEFSHPEDQIFFRNNSYAEHIDSITQAVLDEINYNVRLRKGKWDILDNFIGLKSQLLELIKSFKELDYKCPETNEVLYHNSRARVKSNSNTDMNISPTIDWVNFVLSHYWRQQIKAINKIISYIEIREEIIEKSDDYVKAVAGIPEGMGSIKWTKSDTDLLELITALIESGSIQNSTMNLTRKEAIEAFCKFFNMEIKDAESKLTRATSRKKDVAQFLENLKSTFEEYADSKEDRLDTLRR